MASPNEKPITCYPEPVNCHCPNGSYSGADGLAKLVDTMLQYYAPPKWARWVIGVTVVLWIAISAINKWLDFWVKALKAREIRSLGGSWAVALSVFAKQTPEFVKQREAYEKGLASYM